MKQFYFFRYLLLLLIGITTSALWGQTTFNYTGAVQTYTVPSGVTSIQIECSGAKGENGTGGGAGGNGAFMSGDFIVISGEILSIYPGGNPSGIQSGGDGSYVTNGSGTLLIVAGGGGAGASSILGGAAVVTNDGMASPNHSGGAGGVGGNGGIAGSGSWGTGGGGGWFTSGTNGSGSLGGAALCRASLGTTYAGGAGGGYSGGGGVTMYSGAGIGGGGAGGSYNTGTNQTNTAGANSGNGQVIITPLCNAPVATCQDIIIQLDANGDASITVSQIDNGSTADCGLASISVSPHTFDCSNVGANTVTLTVTDSIGATDTCTATVTVQDLVQPTVICQDITVQLGTDGTVTIDASQVDNGSWDACGIFFIGLDETEFDCSHVGTPQTVTLGVIDNNFNSSSCTATVTVEDIEDPVVTAVTDIIAVLDVTGNIVLSHDVDVAPHVTATDNCGVQWIRMEGGLTARTFTCADIATNPNSRLVRVRDVNGNTLRHVPINVIVVDNIAPVASCQAFTVELDATGFASITAADIDDGSSDACGIASLALDITDFTCEDVGSEIIRAADNAGNYYDIDVSTGLATIIGTINGTCGGPNGVNAMAFDQISGRAFAQSPNGCFEFFEFNPETGAMISSYPTSEVPAALEFVGGVLYGSGILNGELLTIDMDTAVMTPIGSHGGGIWMNGLAYDTASSTMYGVRGGGGITELYTINLSTGVATMIGSCGVSLGSINFDANGNLYAGGGQPPARGNIYEIDKLTGTATLVGPTGIPGPVVVNAMTTYIEGAHTVTLTATDNNGNVSTCTTIVMVEDNIAPEALCNNFTVQLDDTGNASITVAEVDNGSNDACGIASTSIDIDTFDCGYVGDQPVVLTVTDVNGNVSTCTATVTVEDNVVPEALCQDITVQLDASGNASITADQIDNGSNDACGIASLALDTTDFTCSDVASSSTQVWINEFHYDNGGGDVGEFIEIAGTAGLDLAGYSLVPYNGSNGTNYNSTALTGIIDDEGAGYGALDFAISGIQNGAPDGFALVDPSNMVIEFLSYEGSFTANDGPAMGQTSTDVGVTESGGTAIGESLQRIGTGTSGASFSWSGPTAESPGSVNIGQSFAAGVGVTLTVTDNNGNESTCTATVTVEDNVAPIALCQDITVYLDATGNVSITAADVDYGSNDACGIESLEIDVTDFDCSNVGNTPPPTNGGGATRAPAPSANRVIMTVTDKNGNVSTCESYVTVIDNVAPDAVCISGSGGVVTNTVSTSPGVVIDGGDVVSTITITEDILITDLDVILDLPHEWTSDLTITLESPSGTILTLFDDGCSGDDLIMTLDDEAVNDLGSCSSPIAYPDSPYQPSNPLAIFDGESVLGDWILTVNDSWPSGDDGVLNSWALTYSGDNSTPALDVFLDASGNASITADQIDDGSTDACGIDTMTVSPNSFTCADVGDQTVTLTVTDVNGNVSTCTSVIEVIDNTPPVANCQPLTVYLDANGDVSITAAAVNDNSTDACGIADLSLDITDFSCPDVGDHTVTLTVTDVNGNSSTCEATITVIDDIAPVITCPDDITVSNDPEVCEAFVTVPQPDVVDNCISDPCAPITDSGTTVGGPTWDRPYSFSGISSAGPVTYSLFTFTVVESGNFDISSIQDFDGYLHLYENSFDPLDQFTNLLALDDDGNGGIGTSDIEGIALTAGTTYILVTSGWGASDEGNFITSITMDCGGPVPPEAARRVVSQKYENYNGISNIEEAKRAWLSANRVSYRPLDLSAYRGVGEATFHNDYTNGPDASAIYPVGTTDVVWTVTDPSGNSDTCTMQVTVQDNEVPVALCQSITVQLDETGNASITEDQIDNGSTDNCEIDFMTLDIYDFDCADVGDNTVILSVTDIHNNVGTCEATVTVEDNVPPVVLCSDIIVQLDGEGLASISTDNFQSVLTISGDSYSGAPGMTDFTVPIMMGTTITFDWHYTTSDEPLFDTFGYLLNGAYTELSDANGDYVQSGTMSVLLAPGDVFGFRSYTLDNLFGSGTTTVNNFLPSFSGQFDPGNWSLTLVNSDGTAYFQPIAADACGIDSIEVDITDFSCADIGEHTATITAVDVNGNEATCSAIVTVEDSLAPIADITDLPDLADYCMVELPENTATDNCTGSVMGVPNVIFPITDPGTVLVTWTYEDEYGNISTQTQYVTIYDPADPAWQDVDSDGDGYTNGEELAMGSDPCDICDPGPAIPTGPAEQLFCLEGDQELTLADIDVTAAVEHTLNYYDAAGNALEVTASLESGVYVITQTNTDDCESHTGLLVTVTVSNTPAAPVADSPQIFCSADMPTIADIAISGIDVGNVVTWYETDALTGTLSEMTALVDGMTYYVTQTNDDTCESAATAIEVTVSETPDAPTGAADQLFCIAADYPTPTFGDLDATAADGNTLHYYDMVGNEFTATDTLVSGTYSITQTNEYDCESITSLLVTVIVSETPEAPVADSPQIFCSSDMPTIADIAISGIDAGNVVTWYETDALTGTLSEMTALVDGMTYYVTQTNDDTCESAATAIEVVVSVNPDVPTGAADQLFCSVDYPEPTFADIDATVADGNTLHYYDMAGNEFTATDTLVSGTYAITQTNEYDCESTTSLLVNVTVSETPEAPVADSPQIFCSADMSTIADLAISGIDVGNVVTWYETEALTGELSETTALVDGMTYYVTQTNDDTCESSATAIDVIVSVNPDAPTGAADQLFCSSDYPEPIMSDIDATAADDNVLHYYDSVGNELEATDTLVSGTYSITQMNEYGCESTTSLLVEVTVSETPGAPEGPVEQLFCSVDEMTVGDLEVEADLGNYITWYDAESGGYVLDETMLLSTGMYYASQTNPDTCESVEMLAVSVTVTETPEAPEGDAEQSFCASDYPTVGDLSVTADDDNMITWYDTAGNELNLTDELQDGVSYYATQTTSAAPNCESDTMLEVVVEVVTVTTPTGEATQEFCVGDLATVADLVAEVDLNDSYNWYNLSADGTMYELTDLLVDGMYYAEAVNEGGCLSLERFAVEVILDPDCDNDGVLDVEEFDGDTDGDELVDYLDPDDDGDTILTIDEDSNFDGDWFNDDCNDNGVVDYLDPQVCDFVPNAFSPNGDGDNDTWVIATLAQYPDFTLEIYDRWGNIVYDYQNKGRTAPDWWDGTSNGRFNYQDGEGLPAGTYFYLIDFKAETRAPLTGWVYLNR